MDSFTPVASLIGGILIGIAGAGLLLFHGRIAGISGIAGGVIRAERGDVSWRIMFLAGLVATGMIGTLVAPDAYAFTIERSTSALIVAGALVGIGTQLGSGCTSGHGVCGIGRLSRRSFVATVAFMAAAAMTVFVVNHIVRGSV
ncbi:MAG: YeeE/YedE family protein [Myxococcota bacterium]